MKRSIVILLFMFVCGAQSLMAAVDLSADARWDSASTAYVNGRYKQAAELYESIRSQGYSGVKLYYNLGNSYFKNGNIGRSILNYNRALVIDPSDEDVLYNLSLAEVRAKDRINPVPKFFAARWVESLWSAMGSNVWAVISIVFFAMFLVAVVLYMLSSRLSLRKWGFYGALAAAALAILTMLGAGHQKREFTHNDHAIVISSSVPVKSSPDQRSKDLFILHEGTKVKVLASLNGYVEIKIPDGNKGWLDGEAIEYIIPR